MWESSENHLKRTAVVALAIYVYGTISGVAVVMTWVYLETRSVAPFVAVIVFCVSGSSLFLWTTYRTPQTLRWNSGAIQLQYIYPRRRKLVRWQMVDEIEVSVRGGPWTPLSVTAVPDDIEPQTRVVVLRVLLKDGKRLRLGVYPVPTLRSLLQKARAQRLP